MTFYYSDPEREREVHALPNVEVFYRECRTTMIEVNPHEDPGWYFWFCFPGCLPDSEAEGPFETEAAALEAAREE